MSFINTLLSRMYLANNGRMPVVETPAGNGINQQGTAGGAAMVQGSIAYMGATGLAYTPAAGDIPEGPCDAVYLTDDGATLTVKLADDGAGVTHTTPPLPNKQWIPLACVKVTACSAGSVFLGWIRKPSA